MLFPTTANRLLVKKGSIQGRRLLQACWNARATTGRLAAELLVELPLAEARADTLEVGDHVPDLLDGLYLFLQVVALQEVGHLGIVVLGGHFVEVEQRLVDALLQAQSHLHGVQSRAPLIAVRLLDVLQHNTATPLILELHQFLGVLALLIRGGLEELGEAMKGHVVTSEVERHRLVAVGGVELHVDLAVDSSLTLGVVVLANLADGHLEFSLCAVRADEGGKLGACFSAALADRTVVRRCRQLMEMLKMSLMSVT